VAAMPNTEKAVFPDLTFKVFSEFILSDFSSQVSLATVLVLLFTMTENPELLSLHARQQNPVYSEEKNVKVSGWMKALAKALTNRLEDETQTLFKKTEWPLNEDKIVFSLGKKLDGLAKVLGLYPYNKKGKFKGKLKPVSHDEIEPVLVICPDAIVCQSLKCNLRSLQQYTRDRDIPKVDLIKSRKSFQNVSVLTGRCPSCDTTYFADHERFSDDNNNWNRLYLNSARYLKVGQNTWVDRDFFQILF
jgi:CxC5 like cysteine cluster associated with KDZ transposases